MDFGGDRPRKKDNNNQNKTSLSFSQQNYSSDPTVVKGSLTSSSVEFAERAISMGVSLGAGLLAYPFDLMKTRNILSNKPQPFTLGYSPIPFPGLFSSLTRPFLISLFSGFITDNVKYMLSQGMEYSGFWRRSLTEGAPIYMAYYLATLPELYKQIQMMKTVKPEECSQRPHADWNRSLITNRTFLNVSTINSIFSSSFYFIEKGLSEQMRKQVYKKNQEITYLKYDRTSLTEKMLTVPIATIFSYPFEVARVLINKIFLECPPGTRMKNLEIFKKLYGKLKETPMTNLRRPFLPYLVTNYLLTISFLKFNKAISSLQ